ncbi:MAG TPA: nitronate monooxygenase [Saprospiraceae bacterium]|nr:nitronate monooxygenase [Saprospiraceae bacterium]
MGVLIESALKTRLTDRLGIQFPIIMAPMFLVSNIPMLIAAAESGIAGCIPALNFRSHRSLLEGLKQLNERRICYGVNLIVNRTNYKLKAQLKACLEYKVPFIITSLGNPGEVIQACKAKGIPVFCDVSTMDYARKAAQYGPDGLIAVTDQAGGHLGGLAPEVLVPALKREFPDLIVISAGGVGDFASFQEKMSLGADGVSVGTLFIASVESTVNPEYKQACVDYDDSDIVNTTKLSGIPCTVIQTDYVRNMGTGTTVLRKLFGNSILLKKWFKLLTYKIGMLALYKAAFKNTYQHIWCAGRSIRYVHAVKPVRDWVDQLTHS